MKNIFDDYANEYDSWFVENDKLYDAELTAIKKLIVPEKQYIEVGVGTGIFASKLNIKEGVDPSDNMAAIAKKRGIKVINAYADNLPYKDNSLEGVLMVTVDCFIQDLLPTLKEIYRVLDNGGSFIIAFIDRETPLGQEYEKFKDTSTFYKGATFRSAKEMKKLMKEAGFRLIRSKQTVYTLVNEEQPVKCGNGEGVFAVVKAVKEIK